MEVRIGEHVDRVAGDLASGPASEVDGQSSRSLGVVADVDDRAVSGPDSPGPSKRTLRKGPRTGTMALTGPKSVSPCPSTSHAHRRWSPGRSGTKSAERSNVGLSIGSSKKRLPGSSHGSEPHAMPAATRAFAMTRTPVELPSAEPSTATVKATSSGGGCDGRADLRSAAPAAAGAASAHTRLARTMICRTPRTYAGIRARPAAARELEQRCCEVVAKRVSRATLRR